MGSGHGRRSNLSPNVSQANCKAPMGQRAFLDLKRICVVHLRSGKAGVSFTEHDIDCC